MAVTLAARDIGTARVGEHRIRVQRRDPEQGEDRVTSVWMTMLGPREFDDAALGTAFALDTDTPTLRIFQRFSDWDNPATHQLLLAAVRPLYEADEARRGA